MSSCLVMTDENCRRVEMCVIYGKRRNHNSSQLVDGFMVVHVEGSGSYSTVARIEHPNFTEQSCQ